MGDFSYLYDDLADVTGDKSYLKRKPVAEKSSTEGWWTPDRVNQAVTHLQQNARLSPIGAKGLVARWAGVEARSGPDSVNPTSKATGIAQWLGSRKNGVPSDFEGQLNHVVKELNTTESKAANRLRTAKTDEDAAIGASMYERAEGYDPKTGRDNFVNPTLKTLKRLGGTTTAPDYGFLQKDLDEILGANKPDYSFLHQDIADITGTPTADNKGGQPISPTVTQNAPVTQQDVQQTLPSGTPNEIAQNAISNLSGIHDVASAAHQAIQDPNVVKQLANKVNEKVSTDTRVSDSQYENVKPFAVKDPRKDYQVYLQSQKIKGQKPVSYDDFVKWQITPQFTSDVKAQDGETVIPQEQQVNANDAYNAVSDQIEIPDTIKTQKDASEYVRKQLEARYGQDFKGQQFLQGWKPGHGAAIAYKDLIAAGVDINPLISDKVAQNRVENPQPDLRPVDIGGFTPEDVKDTVGKPIAALATDGLSSILPEDTQKWLGAKLGSSVGASGGRVVNSLNGIIKLVRSSNPLVMTGAVDANVGDNVIDFFKTTGERTKSFNDQLALKGVDGEETWPSKIVDVVGGSPADLARLALLSKLPTGAIAGFAADSALQASGQGASNTEVFKQGAKGAVLGALFGGAGLLGKGAEKFVPKILAEGVTLGTIGGGSYAIDKAFGGTDKEAFSTAVMNSLFHLTTKMPEVVIGKTVHAVDAKGNETTVKVDENGKVETVKSDTPADVELAIPKDAKVTVKPTWEEKNNLRIDDQGILRDVEETKPTPVRTRGKAEIDDTNAKLYEKKKLERKAKVSPEVKAEPVVETAQPTEPTDIASLPDGTKMSREIKGSDKPLTGILRENGTVIEQPSGSRIKLDDIQRARWQPESEASKAPTDKGKTEAIPPASAKIAAKPEVSRTLPKDLEPFAKNKVFTPDKVQAARDGLKKIQFNAGLDPVAYQHLATIGAAHVESGIRRFSDFSKQMVDEFGDKIKPHLEALWNTIKVNNKEFRDSMDEPPEFKGTLGMKEPILRKESKLGKDIRDDAIAKGIAEDWGEVASYATNEGIVKEQSAKAKALISQDPEKAMRIVQGKENASEGLHPESVYTALRVGAREANDVPLMMELSKAHVVGEASVLGQRIKMLDTGERTKTDPVAIMQDIAKSRSDITENAKTTAKVDKAMGEVDNAIKTEVKKAKIDKPAWEKFLAKIECA